MDQRVRQYIRAKRVGETLGYVPAKSRQAKRIVDDWMASPGHRSALLSPSFRRVGVGRRKTDLGSGKIAIIALDLASGK